LRVEGYRFAWWSNENREAPHVHVFKGDAAAKWWLNPLAEARSAGYNPNQRRMIRAILQLHRTELLKEWYAHFPEAP
jgi:hypothetical protein